MEPPIILSAVTGLIQSLSIATTSLKPPPPDFRPETYKSYMYELDLAEAELETIPQDIVKTWEEHIFHTRNTFKTMIPDDSLAGRMIQYAQKPIGEFEEKTRKNIYGFYHRNTDEVDRIALKQLGYILSLAWRKVGDYVAHNLVEGAFLGYNDQENFDRATRFSFQRMMHHATKVDALRELTFHKDSLYFVRNRLDGIQMLVKQQSEKHKLWRYRWMTAEKVNILNVVLSFQLELYQNILVTLPDNAPHKLRYMVLKNHHKLNHILAEIKASYFNQMVEIKPKSWMDQKCQDGINWLSGKLATLNQEPIIPSRPFIEVYADALNTIWQVYDQLLPPKKEERKFEEALADFVSAVSEDNFIQAKWISLGTVTPKANFNWLKEAADFENYKRVIDRLIHIQNQMDELITHLHHINGRLFNTYVLEEQISNTAYIKVNNLIYSVWDLRNKIDELRIYYRMAYLKKVRTTVNEHNTGYWDRFKQSIINKATRKILEGEFFDKTETQEEVVLRVREFRKQYEEKLSQIELLVKEVSAQSPDQEFIPKELLAPISRGEEFYPVFYTFDAYNKVFKDRTALTEEAIRHTHYNLKRICRMMPQDKFWRQQLRELENYSYVDRQFEKLFRLAGLYMRIAQETPSTDFHKWITHVRETSKNIRDKLHLNFHKFIISEWNRIHPVTVSRAATSMVNKTVRVLTEGKVSDETQEFKDIYDDLINIIDTLAEKLKTTVNLESQELDAITIGNVLMYIPPNAQKSDNRGTRREKRSRSLLLLEAKSPDDNNL